MAELYAACGGDTSKFSSKILLGNDDVGFKIPGVHKNGKLT
jgi:hypothetical protein